MISKPKIIAVVDDESPIRTMLGRLLRHADYEVSSFASGDAFLASLTGHEVELPACAILDVHMPGLSGFEVHSRLRAARMPIPVVFITASDDAALEHQAADATAVCLLRKPFSTHDLLGAVGRALEPGHD